MKHQEMFSNFTNFFGCNGLTHISTRPIAVVNNDRDEPHFEDVKGSPEIPAYTYQALPRGNHFRLLKLKPGNYEDPLCCDIKTYSLDAFNIPPYRALSYTWGDSKYDRLIIAGRPISMADDILKTHSIRHPIWCGEDRLLISTNLKDALRQLRHATLPLKLWVDAISINVSEGDFSQTRILAT
jgi:hypothetical protein